MLHKTDDVAHWIISFKILFWDLITLHLSVLLLLGLGGGGVGIAVFLFRTYFVGIHGQRSDQRLCLKNG